MITIDARGWEAPAPFDAVLEALCQLPGGQTLRLIIDREPFPLYSVLERNGYAHYTSAFDDGHYEIDICERSVG
jgi:uncharacterized protein (DUF2249 family)